MNGKRHAYMMVCVACWSLLCVAAHAQAVNEDAPLPSVTGTTARIIDKFNPTIWDYDQARLDNFAIELQNYPHSRGQIIVYGGRDDLPGVAEHWTGIVTNYLTMSRGIDQSRFKAVNGGRKDSDKVELELWLVPPRASAPDSQPDLTEDTRKPPTGKIAEGETEADSYYECEDGPCIDRTRINLAGWLERAPDLHAYIVVHTKKDESPGAAHMIGNRERSNLLGGAKVNDDRVTVIHAGEAATTKVEWWLLPHDAPPPAVEAKTPALAPQSFKLGDVNAYMLSDADYVKWQQQGVADILREHASAHVVLIVHPPGAKTHSVEAPAEKAVVTEDENEESKASEPDSIEPERAAAEWKKEFIEKYKLDERRIEILVGRVEKDETGSLAAWIVPEGATPPNPFAEETSDAPEDQPSDEPQDNTSVQPQPPSAVREQHSD